MRKLFLSIVLSSLIGASFPDASAQNKSKEKLPEMRAVKVYVYQKPAETSAAFQGKTVPVRRKIIDYEPLNAAMKLLLAGANREEQKRNLTNFIFGLEFYSARIENKTAQINFKFHNPEIALERWEGGGFAYQNFVKAVELTAKQFPGVERVSICVDSMKNYINFDQTAAGKCAFPMFAPPQPRKIPADEIWDVEIFLNNLNAPPLPMGARESLPVKRRVKAADFLTETLKAFDAGASDAEQKQGWISPAYGAKFVSARIKNKKAFVKFKMPSGSKFPDRHAPLGFYFAVTQTALQFWNEIEDIEICVNDAMNFYAEYQEPIPCEEEPKK